jgi:Villin headpiece domain
VFLLDIYSMIICWVGGSVSTQEGDLALDYGSRLHESLVQIDGRSPESILVKVESGEEIALFTDYFLDWDKMDAEVVEKVAQQSEIAEVLQQQKVAYEEALAPQEEPPEEITKSRSTMDIISPTQLEAVSISKSASKVLKPTPAPVAKNSAAASISKWGEFKQDFSFVDIYPKVDPKKRVDYETLKKDYATLKEKNVEVNPMKKEVYLDEPIFQELFQCSKAEFEALPVWKRAQMKKKVGLF